MAVGAGAALLVSSIEWVGEALHWIGARMGMGKAAVLFTVPAGLLAAYWVANRMAPEVVGDGVPAAAEALAVRGGYVPGRAAPYKILATALTLGGGGSAGREGPIVQVGASVGSFVARRFGLGEDQIRGLVAAGAGAGIGASFNAPIAGMLFAMEVILGSFAVRHISAVVVASVAAAVTSRQLVGEELALRAFPWRLQDPRELLLYALLALVVVAAAYLFLRVLDLAEWASARWSRLGWFRPVLVGLAIGGLGMVEPDLLGTGQRFVGELLKLELADTTMWWALLSLALLKIVATSATLGARTSGGAFMPSLFIGATVGAAFADLVDPLWNISPIMPGPFAVVGMAAVFAAVARAPLTAILIVFEITGDYNLVLPLMLTAALATTVIDRLHPETVYTMALSRKGIRPVRTSEVDLLDTVTVGEVMSRNPTFVTPSMSLQEVQRLFDQHRHHGLAVVDADGDLVGIISVTDILRAGETGVATKAGEVMTRRPVTVTPDLPVSMALERMAALGVGRLPVVDAGDPWRLVGMFRREDAVRAYHHALSASTAQHLEHGRLRQRTDPGTEFFEFRIPTGSMADGKPVREVAWPEGATLVSVRRQREVLVPTGSTVLQADDVVAAFGTKTARSRLIERLNATGDEPTAEIILPPVEDQAGDA